MYRHILSLGCVLILSLGTSIADAQVKIERKFRENTKVTTNIETKTHQILTIGQQDVETNSTQFIVLVSELGQRTAEGKLSIVNRFDKLQSETSLPGGITLAFDSSDPDKKADVPQLEVLLNVLRATAKSKWTTVLDKQDKIVSLTYDKDVLDSVDPIFKSQFDPETRKKALEQEQALFPDEPVKPGDKWSRTINSDLSAGQTLTLDSQFEYVGTVEKDGKKLDKIVTKADSVSFSQDQNAPTPVKVTGSELKVEESEGTLLFDRELGRYVETTSKLRIKGTLKLSINGMELPGKLDLEIASKTNSQE